MPLREWGGFPRQVSHSRLDVLLHDPTCCSKQREQEKGPFWDPILSRLGRTLSAKPGGRRRVVLGEPDSA
jgi:hypothetical protein